MAVDNLEQLSDEELIKLANDSDDLESLSDEELIKLADEIEQPQKKIGLSGAGKYLPTFISGQKPARGERTLFGNIYERPGKALTSAFFGEGYQKGANFPEETKSFLERSQGRSFGSPNEPVKTFLKGLGTDIVATGADIVTQPASILTGSSMTGQAFKNFAGIVSKTKPAQNITNFFHTERSFIDIAKNIAKKFPKIHSPNWIENQAKQGQFVADGIQEALSNSYSKIYNKIGDISVNADRIDEILLNSNIDDTVLKAVQQVSGGRIDTVDKAKDVIDVLNKLTPQSYYMKGGTIGKGGMANQKVLNIQTYRAIKEELRASVAKIDKNAAQQLESLDTFAHNKVYPHLDKMRSIFGKKEIPNTQGMVGAYNPFNIGSASSQQSIKRIPKISKEFETYIEGDYKKDLLELTKNSEQLIKDMKKFQTRQIIKKVGGVGGLLGGGVYGASRIGQ